MPPLPSSRKKLSTVLSVPRDIDIGTVCRGEISECVCRSWDMDVVVLDDDGSLSTWVSFWVFVRVAVVVGVVLVVGTGR